MTHGYELRGGRNVGGRDFREEDDKGEGKMRKL